MARHLPTRLALLLLVLLGLLGACHRDEAAVTGSFGGDVDLGGGFMLMLADGGEANFIERAPKGEGRVEITKNDDGRFSVVLDSPLFGPTKCRLVARWNGDEKRLDIEGPGEGIPPALGLYGDTVVGKGAWQACTLHALGYDGEVNVAGHASASGTDAIHLKLWLYPRAGGAIRGVEAGSAANADFVGSRLR